MTEFDEPKSEIVNKFENLIVNNNLIGMRMFIYFPLEAA